jgi:hypothetical protein
LNPTCTASSKLLGEDEIISVSLATRPSSGITCGPPFFNRLTGVGRRVNQSFTGVLLLRPSPFPSCRYFTIVIS